MMYMFCQHYRSIALHVDGANQRRFNLRHGAQKRNHKKAPSDVPLIDQHIIQTGLQRSALEASRVAKTTGLKRHYAVAEAAQKRLTAYETRTPAARKIQDENL